MVYNAMGSRSSILPASLASTLRSRYSLLLASVFTASCLLLYISNSSRIIFYESTIQSNWEKSLTVNHNEHDHSFTIKTEGCTIPALEPFDPAIIKYVRYPKKARHSCRTTNTTLLSHNKTHIWVKLDILQNYDVNERLKFTCCYQKFYRPNSVSDITSSQADERVTYDDCKHFYKSIQVGKDDEFVRVICIYNKTEIYKQFYLFAPKKNYISHDGSKEVPKNKKAYNVIVLGIDAVSRLNFYRTMPKTVSWLKGKGAIDLKGYNKVGDNTYPNLIPMLLGVSVAEIKKLCVPHNKATFDNCPFIWEWFKQAGYYTALGEDSGWLGLFNYVRYGFLTNPVDYYLHPFISAADTQVGKNKDFNSNLCMQDEYFYKVLLNYVEDLVSTLKSNKLFGFFWEITMSHDYLNYPMIIDDSYVDALKRMDESGYLNETIVLVMSDHGIRWGEIRSTKQGRLEERLPFVFMLTPQEFRQRYSSAYAHLKLNSQRLTTPFDLHETLSDLLDLDNIKNNKINTRANESYSANRGISLFLPVPGNRTCASAGIDDHWCTCHSGHKIDSQSKEAKEAGFYLIHYLNNLLKDQQQCANLMLEEILDATEMVGYTKQDEKDEWREFLIVVRTEPGGGIFEATLRQSSTKWSISGTVSRLNLYGDQSHCVNNTLLKLFCYCNDMINQIR